MTALVREWRASSLRRRVDVLLPYLLVVAASWLGSYYFSTQTTNEVASIAYNNAVAACERANASIRAPLRSFMLGVVNEDAVPADLQRLAHDAHDAFDDSDCQAAIQHP